MRVTRCLLSAVLGASLALSPPAAWATSPLPSEAAAHNERGMALYERGELEAAFAELSLAYAAMPDARRFDVGRDIVLASMRAALLDLYDQTGDARHLCRARDMLLLHLEALLEAFGEDTTIEDVPGTRWRLQQIREALAQHVPKPGESPDPCGKGPSRASMPARVFAPTPAAVPDPPRLQESAPGRPWTIAGGAALGLGGALLGAMTYGLFMRRANFVAIRELDAQAQARGEATPAELATVATLTETGERQRTLAIATGISGGILAAVGAAALIVDQVRARRARLAVTPAVSPHAAGIFLMRSF